MKNQTAQMHYVKATVVTELASANNSATVKNTSSTPVETNFTPEELVVLNNPHSIEGHLQKGRGVKKKDVVFTAAELAVLNNPHSIEGHLQKGRGLV